MARMSGFLPSVHLGSPRLLATLTCTIAAAVSIAVPGNALAAPYHLPAQAVDNIVPPPPDVTADALPDGPGKPATFTFSSTATDVVSFRYGWSDPPLKEVAATTTTDTNGATIKAATVTTTAERYGQNTLYVYAIDATGNKGDDARYEFLVGRPAPAVARWGLETYPGVDRDAALADRQPALAGDTPLSATSVDWVDDVRLIGAQTPTFANNSASVMSTSNPVVDVNRSFSVAAWLRIGLDGQVLPGANKAAVTQVGDRLSSFGVGYRGESKRWAFWMHQTDKDNSPSVWATSPTAPVLGAWTHVAGVYDAAERQLRLYVNGTAVASTTVGTAPSWSTARSINLGRDLFNRRTTAYWKGSIADVQVFDRALVGHDFTGQVASDPESGGIDEPSILAPTEVGRWDFENAVPCYAPEGPATCEAVDGLGWNRRLALTAGADIGLGNRNQGLLLDGQHWIEDPFDPQFGAVTQEYGRSQRNTAAVGQPAQWQDTPVLRTDQSFTVSAWVRLNQTNRYQTVASQDGAVNGGFYLYYATDDGGTWKFTMLPSTTAANDQASSATAPAVGLDRWHHLVGVLDIGARQIRLYVDGSLAATANLPAEWQLWQADGPLTVGRTRIQGVDKDWLDGALDNVAVYQGALTDAAVNTLHDAEAVIEPFE